MHRIIEVIRIALRVASATRKRRLLLAIVLSMIVAVPSYAAIISNTTYHTVTIQDVTITSSPAVDSTQPSGSTETGTVTVHTPQPFTGRLTLSITNSTTGATTVNPLAFTVTINAVTTTGVGGSATIAYITGTMPISDGTVISYTVRFLSKAENAVNGIQSGTAYTISQVVSE